MSININRRLAVLSVIALSPPALAASSPESSDVALKGFEAAVSLSQILAQWAFLIVGGSVVVLLGTSYRRPGIALVRWCYILFIPAWGLLGLSIYTGMRVQEVYVAYLLLGSPDAVKFKETLTHDAHCQIQSMEWALFIFAAWLVIYLLWWITHRQTEAPEGK